MELGPGVIAQQGPRSRCAWNVFCMSPVIEGRFGVFCAFHDRAAQREAGELDDEEQERGPWLPMSDEAMRVIEAADYEEDPG